MIAEPEPAEPQPAPERPAVGALPTRAMLIALLAGASLAFSMVFACATPFPALAAAAVVCMTRRDAFAVVALAWLVNQADGYLFMHYPRTWDSFGWGVAILLAAAAATFAASAVIRLAGRAPLQASPGALAAALVTYESVLMAAQLPLSSSPGAFSPSVVGLIMAINAGAFVLLLALIALLEAVGASLPSGIGMRKHPRRRYAGIRR